MKELLEQRDFVNGATLSYFEDQGARHNERAWARRFRKVLPFLLGGPCPEAGRRSGTWAAMETPSDGAAVIPGDGSAG